MPSRLGWGSIGQLGCMLLILLNDLTGSTEILASAENTKDTGPKRIVCVCGQRGAKFGLLTKDFLGSDSCLRGGSEDVFATADGEMADRGRLIPARP